MHTSSRPITKMILFKRVFITALIVGVCILFCLYLLGFLKIPFLESLRFKFTVTFVALCSAIIYLFTYFVFKRYKKIGPINWETFGLLGLLFEGPGYWWVDTIFGKILIVIGFIFLIFGLISEYRN